MLPSMDQSAPRSSGMTSPHHMASRSRTQSISSDKPSSFSHTMATPPLSISPDAAFIAPSAASQIVTNDHDGHADSWYDQHFMEPSSEAAMVSPAALHLANGFLDHLLLNFLRTSRTTALPSLREAVVEVLKPKLAKDAINQADEELREYLGGAIDDANDEVAHGSNRDSGRSHDWDLELVWKRTRLRCMVYSSLGDVEEEDEDFYVDQESLDSASDNQAEAVSPAVAIFLTSILEYMGEQALIVAGQAAFVRMCQKYEKDHKDGLRTPAAVADRLVVEELDMERVVVDRTLGRLWRAWKKKMRSPPIGAGADHALGPARSYSRDSLQGLGVTGHARSQSVGAESFVPSTAAKPAVEPVVEREEAAVYPEQDETASRPLPRSSRDAEESGESDSASGPDGLGMAETTEEDLPRGLRRPRSLLLPVIRGLGLSPSPLSSEPNNRLITHHHHSRKRSSSLPPVSATNSLASTVQWPMTDGPVSSSKPSPDPHTPDKDYSSGQPGAQLQLSTPVDRTGQNEPPSRQSVAESEPADDADIEEPRIMTSSRVSISARSSPPATPATSATSDRGSNKPLTINTYFPASSPSIHELRLIEVSSPRIPTAVRPGAALKSPLVSSRDPHPSTVEKIVVETIGHGSPDDMPLSGTPAASLDRPSNEATKAHGLLSVHSAKSGLAMGQSIRELSESAGDISPLTPDISPILRGVSPNPEVIPSMVSPVYRPPSEFQQRELTSTTPRQPDYRSQANQPQFEVHSSRPIFGSVVPRSPSASPTKAEHSEPSKAGTSTTSHSFYADGLSTVHEIPGPEAQVTFSASHQPAPGPPTPAPTSALPAVPSSRANTAPAHPSHTASLPTQRLPAPQVPDRSPGRQALVTVLPPTIIHQRYQPSDQQQQGQQGQQSQNSYQQQQQPAVHHVASVAAAHTPTDPGQTRTRTPSDSSRRLHTSGSSTSSTGKSKGGRSDFGDSVARSFEELIHSNETMKYTLTPENINVTGSYVTATIEASSAKVRRSEDNRRPGSRSRSSSAPRDPVTAKTALSSHAVAQDRPLRTKHSHSSSSSATSNRPAGVVPRSMPAMLSKPRPGGQNARDAQVPRESLSDLADFLRTTGPLGPADVSVGRATGASAPRSAKPPPVSMATAPGSTWTRARTTSEDSGTRAARRLQARDAASDRLDNSDLIDFIRRGPPSAQGNPRVPKNIAPFRTTMDSDQSFGALGGKATDGLLADMDMRSSQASTSITDYSMPSVQSSTNSHSALLTKSRPAASGPNKGRAVGFDDDDMPMPARKTRRVRDPYAIDFSDEEDDELLQLGHEVRRGGGQDELSLADFLRSVEPPPSPPMAAAQKQQPRKKASAPSLMSRLTRRDSAATGSSAKAARHIDTRSLSSRGGPLSGHTPIHTSVPPLPMAPPIPQASAPLANSKAAALMGGGGYAAPMGRMPMKKPQAREAVAESRATSDLADFFKNSEPPMGMDSMMDRTAPMDAPADGGGFSKVFSRRKKSAYA